MDMPSDNLSSAAGLLFAGSDGASQREPWPLVENGKLPGSLLGPQYLEQIFLRAGPVRWKCSAQAVRRAFKALAKRHSVATSSLNFGVELSERDRALVQAVCDNEKSRNKFSTLEIIAAKRDVSGRGGKWTHIPTVDSFAETVWYIGYHRSSEESLRELAEWTLRVGTSRVDIGPGKYLEAEGLRRALAAGDCPVEIDTVDFARVIVLFAARLPLSERRGLLSAAIDGGCAELSSLLISPPTEDHPIEEPLRKDGGQERPVAQLDPPRLREPGGRSYRASIPSSALKLEASLGVLEPRRQVPNVVTFTVGPFKESAFRNR
jgi:hypothetical protein